MKQENTKVEFNNNESSLKLEYDDQSPFTGNQCVLIEADEKTGSESRICMESGYTTMDKFQVDTDIVKAYERQVPQLYKDTKYVDQILNQVWYLSTMRTDKACLYADGTTKDNYTWKLAYVKELTSEERKQYPVDGKENEYHTHKVDVQNALSFDRNDFKGAMDKFYEAMRTEDDYAKAMRVEK